MAYLFVTESDAAPLVGQPSSRRRFGCDYRALARLPTSVPIGDLRADPVTATWPALRSGFVGSAMAVPPAVWDRLMAMAGLGSVELDRRSTAARALAAAERQIADGLAAEPRRLHPFGEAVAELRTGVPCPGAGAADVVGFDEHGAPQLVVAVKKGWAGTNAVGQLSGHLSAVDEEHPTPRARGVLVADGLDARAAILVKAHPRIEFLPLRALDLDGQPDRSRFATTASRTYGANPGSRSS